MISAVLKALFKIIFWIAIIGCVAIGGFMIYVAVSSRADDSKSVSAPAYNLEDTVTPVVSAEGLKVSVEMTEIQAAAMFQEAMADTMPVENIAVEFNADQTAKLSGTISKESLKAALTSGGKELPTLIDAGINLLPVELNLTIEMSAGINEDGEMELQPRSFGVGGLSIGADYLPAPLVESFNQQLNSFAKDNGIYVTEIGISNGLLKMSGYVG